MSALLSIFWDIYHPSGCHPLVCGSPRLSVCWQPACLFSAFLAAACLLFSPVCLPADNLLGPRLCLPSTCLPVVSLSVVFMLVWFIMLICSSADCVLAASRPFVHLSAGCLSVSYIYLCATHFSVIPLSVFCMPACLLPACLASVHLPVTARLSICRPLLLSRCLSASLLSIFILPVCLFLACLSSYLVYSSVCLLTVCLIKYRHVRIDYKNNDFRAFGLSVYWLLDYWLSKTITGSL